MSKLQANKICSCNVLYCKYSHNSYSSDKSGLLRVHHTDNEIVFQPLLSTPASNINILRGSVATQAWGDGFFNGHFIVNLLRACQ